MKTLAQRFTFSREKAGLTQLQLAEKAKVSQTTISKIENGETKKPKDINRFAKILRVSVDFLETGEEQNSNSSQLEGLSYSAADLVMLIQELDKQNSIPDSVYKSLKVIIESGFSPKQIAVPSESIKKGLDSQIRD
ncbi:helix-turn-helix domain-containing protein [Alteromonas sp. IB21]|uniref:helix-turn-helix domain-containing protein n=1 Tax=Alteromonas sp. IB21 TaxID=2779369 RepID=UPI0018E7CAA8|nr:XRE family transcriptional regulator [Alteromonas sp. IB21]MBJ2129099.1 helix-turn-helix domain-containing protein [Alteromonas sp. IB21]